MLHLFTSKESDENRTANIKQLRGLVKLMFEYLPYDTKAGNLMSSLYGIYKGKKKWLEGDKAAELNFDCLITAPLI